jgi:hypothetical protein
MPIHKGKFVGKGFTMVPNEAWNLLSNNGMLLLTYLLGKPETWEIRKAAVGQDLKWGVDKIDETFRELAKAGYVRFVRIRDERNVILGSEIHVTNIVGVFSELDENPDETTTMEITVVDSPQGVVSTGVENHGRGNNSHSNKEVSNKDLSNTLMCAFDAIWSDYPRKLNKAGAAKAFAALVKRGASIDDIHRAVENYSRQCAGREPRYVMHGATFFGPNDRWKDYLASEPDQIIRSGPSATELALAELRAQDELRAAQKAAEDEQKALEYLGTQSAIARHVGQNRAESGQI